MKITGGFLRSRSIDSPTGDNVRPTLSQVRESIFSSLFSLIDFEGKTFLDVFAGSGIIGFEAISRGFASTCFLEKDKKTFLLLKKNASKLALSDNQVSFYIGDSTKVLKNFERTFDVIYVDPPYQSGLYERVLAVIFEKHLLSNDGILVLEHPKNLEIDFEKYNLIKQKTYADKTITFLSFL